MNNGNRKAVFASNYKDSKDLWTPSRIAGMHYVQTIKQLNYIRTLIPSNTRSDAKVDVCVLLVVLRGCQSTKKRPVFVPRTSVFFSSRRVVTE